MTSCLRLAPQANVAFRPVFCFDSRQVHRERLDSYYSVLQSTLNTRRWRRPWLCQEDPNNAQALVWRGAARSFQAGQAFRAGDIARGRELAAGGMSDMDRAVSLEPGTIGVLIPRASTLLAAARFQPDPVRARDLASRAAADFEAALAIRQGVFDKLPQHNRGEYLSGLAESWAIAGDKASAERYLQRIVSELPNTRYADRAAAKLADWNDHGALNCQSCH
jgi:tetratricopeptide (TPR) repeat protein